MNKQLKHALYGAVGTVSRACNRISHPGSPDSVAVFNTAMGTDNLGDQIIMQYCSRFLQDTFPGKNMYQISCHRVPTQEETALVRGARYRIVCGTNLLTSHIETHWYWQLPDGYRGKLPFRNAVLLGVGWQAYQDACSDYTRMIYRMLLDPNLLHSVRDSYSARQLRRSGISNVCNTGCVTMWGLTPEFCRDIPREKAKDVITTLTDYRRDPEQDQKMLDILSANYEHVGLWLQGRQDEAYLQTLQRPENLQIIPRSLQAFEQQLKPGETDYVGTRLHAGIHALNYGVRSLILGVDNRAAEIARDTNLPVLPRENISLELQSRIREPGSINIHIPQEKISTFRSQFQQRKR